MLSKSAARLLSVMQSLLPVRGNAGACIYNIYVCASVCVKERGVSLKELIEWCSVLNKHLRTELCLDDFVVTMYLAMQPNVQRAAEIKGCLTESGNKEKEKKKENWKDKTQMTIERENDFLFSLTLQHLSPFKRNVWFYTFRAIWLTTDYCVICAVLVDENKQLWVKTMDWRMVAQVNTG